MQRIPKKSSSQQSLIIIILIILIIIAISINLTLAWFYGRATNSRIEVNSNFLIASEILNGKTLNIDEEERYPGAVIDRTLRIQKSSSDPSFYLRMRPEFRIDGLTTNLITFNIAEEDQDEWLLEDSINPTWYYCYTDFDTWFLETGGSSSMSALVHFQFTIDEDISPDRLNRVLTVILYLELVPLDANLNNWQGLPLNWPYVPQ
jgi:hypothetical protein